MFPIYNNLGKEKVMMSPTRISASAYAAFVLGDVL
jgi:hypothetical protein